MMQVLQMGGVEIQRATTSFTADGRDYPAGTHIIDLSQPYGGYAKALLERQVYPEIREVPGGPLKTPYDVVGHTLPLLMGVEALAIEKDFTVEAVLQERLEKPGGKIEDKDGGYGYIWGHATNDDIMALNRLLRRGYKVLWTAGEMELEGIAYPPGLMIVRAKEGLRKDLEPITEDLYVHFRGLESEPGVSLYGLKPVRLGLYKSWSAFVVHEGTSVVRYPAEVLMSGWITGEDYLVNKSAIVDVPFGKGKVILIGFPVQYRGQAYETFRYLFNAIYYGTAAFESK